MWRFILITFGFLGFAFYELSGGSDYAPRAGSLQVVQAERRAMAAQKATALAEAKPKQIAPRPAAAAAAATSGEAQIILAAAGSDTAQPAPKPMVASLAQPVVDITKADKLTQAAENIMQPRAAATPSNSGDIRRVKGNRVNLRQGPGTSYSRVGSLTRGAEVDVLEDDGSGWVKLRVLETGKVAYIADFLLTAPSADARLASN